MIVELPAGRSGDVEVRHIIAGRPSFRDIYQQRRRAITPEGTVITCLYRAGHLWMSDTVAEQRDHMPAITKARQLGARRALVNGLGIGMVVRMLLVDTDVEHIDVVELDADVIALVAEHYQQLAASLGKTIAVVHGDAFTIQWPAGTSWDICWSDIWKHASVDNLPQMTQLARKYGRRVRWHGQWLREMLLTQRRRDSRYAARF
jgi:predicted membrane-bound spermidine synthase